MSATVTITGAAPTLLEAVAAAGCTTQTTVLYDMREHATVYSHGRIVGQITPSLSGYNNATMELDTAYLGMAGVVLVMTALVGKPGYN